MKNSTNQLVTLLLYILLLFVGTILSMLKVTGHPYFGIVTAAAVVITVIMIYFVHENGANEVEDEKFDPRKFVTWALIGAIGALLIQIGMGFIEENLLHITTSSQNTMTLLTTAKGYPYYLIYIVICAPIMEEIIFRRVFFANLIKPTNIYWAMIISSLLFAFMHRDTRFAIYLVMGLWFCFVYSRSKNIYASAASHIIMNAVVIGLSFA